MGEVFYAGEKKPRPGTYYRVDRTDYPRSDGVAGIGGCLFKADWGPLNKVVEVTKDNYQNIFGNAGTTDAVKFLGFGGASTILACRVGTGGKAAELTLPDAGKITAKYAGAKAFTLAVRAKLTDENVKEVIIYDGTKVFEKYEIAAGGDEAGALAEAMGASENFTFEKTASGNESVVAAAAQTAFTAGTDPACTAESYSAGFEALETHKMHVLVVDTEDAAVHALLQAELTKLSENARFALGFIAEKTSDSLPYADKLGHAAGFNDQFMHYILNPRVKFNGEVIDGYQTAALVAGMVSSYKCRYSLTHKTLPNVTGLEENAPIEVLNAAPKSGAITLTLSRGGDVWLDAGINTLVTPPGNMDEGWKSIRRVRTRIELIERSMDAAEGLVGNVDNDADGRAAVVTAVNGVIKDMVAEGSIVSGQVYEDTDNIPDGSSAYFGIDVVDRESAEKLYVTFRFQFSTNAG